MKQLFMLIIIIIAIVALLNVFFPYIATNFNRPKDEKFSPVNRGWNHFYILDRPPYYKTHTNFPWWNNQIGTTRNMSYDLRGDIPLFHNDDMFWNQSSYVPIMNKPVIL